MPAKIFTAILLLCTTLYAGAQSFAPADINASPEARRILKPLYDISEKPTVYYELKSA